MFIFLYFYKYMKLFEIYNDLQPFTYFEGCLPSCVFTFWCQSLAFEVRVVRDVVRGLGDWSRLCEYCLAMFDTFTGARIHMQSTCTQLLHTHESISILYTYIYIYIYMYIYTYVICIVYSTSVWSVVDELQDFFAANRFCQHKFSARTEVSWSVTRPLHVFDKYTTIT